MLSVSLSTAVVRCWLWVHCRQDGTTHCIAAAPTTLTCGVSCTVDPPGITGKQVPASPQPAAAQNSRVVPHRKAVSVLGGGGNNISRSSQLLTAAALVQAHQVIEQLPDTWLGADKVYANVPHGMPPWSSAKGSAAAVVCHSWTWTRTRTERAYAVELCDHQMQLFGMPSSEQHTDAAGSPMWQ